MRIVEKLLDTIKQLGTSDKEEGMRAVLSDVGRQFRDNFGPPLAEERIDPHIWVRDIVGDNVLASIGEKNFLVPFTRNDKGVASFADRPEWKEVVRKEEWVETGKAIALDASLKITKDASNNYRWTMVTSSAFEDREDETVSIKALTADVERTDKGDDPGPLRWWHIGEPDIATKSAGPGMDIGKVDFRAIHSKSLIESGTFSNPVIGEAFSKAKNLSGSIMFFHPIDQPDKEGVYHNIHSGERSLLLAGKQSNLLTVGPLIEKDIDMNDDKMKVFTDIVGEDAAKVFLGDTDKKEQRAEAAGISSKESDQAIDPGELVKAIAGVLPDAIKPIVQTEVKSAMETLKAELTSESGNEEDAATKAAKEQAEREKAITGKLDTLTTGLAEVTKAVKELIGDQPRSNKGYRPTKDDATLLNKDAIKAAESTDPLGHFISNIMDPKNGQ